MRIPSHVLITAALNKITGKRFKVITSAALIGSVAPDLPLVVLSVCTALVKLVREGRPITNIHSFMFDDLFFNDPLWIIAHNTLHSPVLLATALVVTNLFRTTTLGRWFFWFFVACAFHTLLDIPTHSIDGPLLLFPFNWTFRFYSPVSYWEIDHYGSVVTVIEYSLDVALIVFLAFTSRQVKHK
jgi:hypothetical protein